MTYVIKKTGPRFRLDSLLSAHGRQTLFCIQELASPSGQPAVYLAVMNQYNVSLFNIATGASRIASMSEMVFPITLAEAVGHGSDVKTSKSDEFWLNWVEGNGQPSKKHLTEQDAVIEATRLSKISAKTVYVLQPIAKLVPQEPRLETLR